MKITDPHLKWNDGDLFLYHSHIEFYTDLNGAVGIILGKGDNLNGRVYKAKIAHMTLWVTIHNMEKL